MLRSLLALLFASSLFACDSSNALRPLANPSTDPSLLAQSETWVAVSAVSNGDMYEFTGSDFTASFTADGRIGGRASANSYGGEYEADPDGTFAASDIVTTLIGLSPSAERLSSVLLGELLEADRFEVEGSTLDLLSSDGDGLRFRLTLAEHN